MEWWHKLQRYREVICTSLPHTSSPHSGWGSRVRIPGGTTGIGVFFMPIDSLEPWLGDVEMSRGKVCNTLGIIKNEIKQ